MPDFLGIERLSLGPWPAFERAIQRLLLHRGFDDVRLVAGSGDGGADVVGEVGGKLWVVQAKFRRPGLVVGAGPIDEVTVAVSRYRADAGLVVTNTGFTADAIAATRKRSADMGVPIFLWNHDVLGQELERLALYPEHRHEPRPYQSEAIEAINQRIMAGRATGLLLMATGLGKTRVAAGVIEQWLEDRPHSEVLVLAPTLALVAQLEASLWPYLPKSIATHQLTGSEKPAFEGGVTVATAQSTMHAAGDLTGRFGLVIVDEAHHAPADGHRSLIDHLETSFLLGMTATPWRGDERQLSAVFGDPTYSVGIVEGLQLGYLASVDYRMLVDTIDWGWVQDELGASVSVRDLNKRLFIPERDEAVVGKIRDHLASMERPRCVIFCRSVSHAESIGALLQADGVPVRLAHSKLDRFEATRALHEFRNGSVPVIVSVDMLNEGIDVPDVNVIVFLRVTHSRRIFIQQLGRGLRITEGKTAVRVLDFVSDVRRIAAAIDLNRQAAELANESPGSVVYNTGDLVRFENDESLRFFSEYLADVAELDSASDEARLKFPANR